MNRPGNDPAFRRPPMADYAAAAREDDAEADRHEAAGQFVAAARARNRASFVRFCKACQDGIADYTPAAFEAWAAAEASVREAESRRQVRAA